jgi:hypothetical protein
MLKLPRTKRLKLENDGPPSKFGFKFDLCRYNKAAALSEDILQGEVRSRALVGSAATHSAARSAQGPVK